MYCTYIYATYHADATGNAGVLTPPPTMTSWITLDEMDGYVDIQSSYENLVALHPNSF